jgi:hypothetical protein
MKTNYFTLLLYFAISLPSKSEPRSCIKFWN